MTPRLVGATITHIWPTGRWPGSGYRHEYLSADELRWTGIGGARTGESDTERYIALEISANLLQVAFTERRSRLTKTLTYDFDRRQVHGVMFLPGGEIVTLLGEIVDGPERRPA